LIVGAIKAEAPRSPLVATASKTLKYASASPLSALIKRALPGDGGARAAAAAADLGEALPPPPEERARGEKGLAGAFALGDVSFGRADNGRAAAAAAGAFVLVLTLSP